jgi:uncharacterized protein (DUF2252 family)
MSKPGSSVASRVLRFNAGRDPELLRLKYRALRSDVFTFLRGTVHLFYEDLPDSPTLKKAPPVWLCGDLHLENFGTYRGPNGLVYFDINDFDEAFLAPCTLDLVRLLTSALLVCESIGFSSKQASALCQCFLLSYISAITAGKPQWLEREVAQGMVRRLLEKSRKRSAGDFLDLRTRITGGRRRIVIDARHALPATIANKSRVRGLMKKFAETQTDPAAFKVLDVARRVAGKGSLGVERYVILVRGKGSTNGNYLLDLKQARPSSVAACCKLRQPRWNNDAQRVVATQRLIQAVSPALLTDAKSGKTPFVLRVLQPGEDKIDLNRQKTTFNELRGLMQSLGNIVAWGELRSCGRGGASSIDDLIGYWRKPKRMKNLLRLAQRCAGHAESQWREYCVAYDAGALR